MRAALQPAGLVVFALLMITAAAIDATRYRIPNWLTAAVAGAAFIFALPATPAAWADRGLSVLIVGAVVLALYVRRAMGGGDVKLLAASSLWMPLATLPAFAIALGLAGGVQAIATLALRRAAAGRPLQTRRRRMPYAVSIAVAGLVWAWLRVRSA